MVLFNQVQRKNGLCRRGRCGPDDEMSNGLPLRMGMEPNLSRGFGVSVMRIIIQPEGHLSGV